jgi:hypothetical protein
MSDITVSFTVHSTDDARRLLAAYDAITSKPADDGPLSDWDIATRPDMPIREAVKRAESRLDYRARDAIMRNFNDDGTLNGGIFWPNIATLSEFQKALTEPHPNKGARFRNAGDKTLAVMRRVFVGEWA